MLDKGKETIATTPLDGEPDLILKMPDDSYAPFVLTVGMTLGFVGLLVHLWWLAVAGFALMVLAMIVWVWPERSLAQTAARVRHV